MLLSENGDVLSMNPSLNGHANGKTTFHNFGDAPVSDTPTHLFNFLDFRQGGKWVQEDR